MSELPPVLERMLALWNGEHVDPRTVYADGCVENGGEQVFGPEEIPAQVESLRTAAPDLRFEVLDAFAATNRWVVRLRVTGTHEGAFPTPLGIARPTGRTFAMHGIEVFEVMDDLIVGVWLGWNYGELYESLGARLDD